jgi:hypothetical protein
MLLSVHVQNPEVPFLIVDRVRYLVRVPAAIPDWYSLVSARKYRVVLYMHVG